MSHEANDFVHPLSSFVASCRMLGFRLNRSRSFSSLWWKGSNGQSIAVGGARLLWSWIDLRSPGVALARIANEIFENMPRKG
jgi:hypothetical protein